MNEVQREKAKKQYEEGVKYIYPQNMQEWADCVKSKMLGEYEGKDIDCSLKFMESLENGHPVWYEYRRIGGHKLPNDFFANVLEIVTKFSKHGIEFYSYIVEHRYSRVIASKEEKKLSNLARRNAQFNKELLQEDFALEKCINF